MKNYILNKNGFHLIRNCFFALSLGFSGLALAEKKSEDSPESLKKVMKQMSARMREMSNHIKDEEMIEHNKKLVQELIEFSVQAKNKLPDDFSELKEEARKEKTQKYQDKIEEVIQLERTLLKTLEEKDTKKAAKIYDELTSLKKKGHKEFRF